MHSVGLVLSISYR